MRLDNLFHGNAKVQQMIMYGCYINRLVILKIVKRDMLVHRLPSNSMSYLRCHVEGVRYCCWDLH